MQQFVIREQSAIEVACHIEPDIFLRGKRLNERTYAFNQRIDRNLFW
jgi:hypothetical protein